MPNIKLDPRCLGTERPPKDRVQRVRGGYSAVEKEIVLLKHYETKLAQLGPQDRELADMYEEKIDALKFHDYEEMRRYGVLGDLRSMPRS